MNKDIQKILEILEDDSRPLHYPGFGYRGSNFEIVHGGHFDFESQYAILKPFIFNNGRVVDKLPSLPKIPISELKKWKYYDRNLSRSVRLMPVSHGNWKPITTLLIEYYLEKLL